jgi:formylglycine-generating enzyme required for sulfatase activity
MALPRVFLSHNQKDDDVTGQLSNHLKSAGVVVWVDTENAGGNFPAAIDTALAECDYVVVILTKDALESAWVQHEVGAAIVQRHQKGIKDILLFKVGPLDFQTLPPLWSVFHVFDATKDNAFDDHAYDAALAQMLTFLSRGTSAPAPESRSQFSQVLRPSGTPIMSRLMNLGYRAWESNQNNVRTRVIIPPMCSVPNGAFTMGSASDDPYAHADEQPQHEIEVTAFDIGQYPVTFAEYAYYLRANPQAEPPRDIRFRPDDYWVTPEWRGAIFTWADQAQVPDRPVVCVTWVDALHYTEWLTKITGQHWRLPTEAEWEKAARWDVGVTPPHARVYPWGDDWDDERANTNNCKDESEVSRALAKEAEGMVKFLSAVGAYASNGDASPYGVHDMAGNVWEWTSTIAHGGLYSKDFENNDDRESRRVLRGGSFEWLATRARTASRGAQPPMDWRCFWGFRLAREI